MTVNHEVMTVNLIEGHMKVDLSIKQWKDKDGNWSYVRHPEREYIETRTVAYNRNFFNEVFLVDAHIDTDERLRFKYRREGQETALKANLRLEFREGQLVNAQVIGKKPEFHMPTMAD
jgi:hypothetical protein